MESEIFNSTYKGTKNFTQHDVHRANATGFSTPADEYMERGIDLNEQLIRNKPATFFFRMNGDSMNGAGIFSGDVLIVDRSITNVNGKVVIAVLNGEMIVRRLEKTLNKIRLIPETAKLSIIDVDPFADFAVWGVVTYVVHAP
ncbi:LexA family protein [Segetibacter koreensis]|uniref:LexA family protein n=1 Tax=Segetibacter koreensis TaxID=398037 RepID=UPI000363E3CA|nr:translesion error-prone DNA polymerase V autoproteolytic subunit [Segetibacter koreensis]